MKFITKSFYKQCSESLYLFKDIRLYNKSDYYEKKHNNFNSIIFGTRKVQSFLSSFPGISLEYIVILSLVLFIYFLTRHTGNIAEFGTLFIFYAVVGRRLMSCMGQIISHKNTLNFYLSTTMVFLDEFKKIKDLKSFTKSQKYYYFFILIIKKHFFFV